MNKYDEILNVIKNFDDCDIVSIWNEFCMETNRMDDYLEDMQNLQELYSNDIENLMFRVFYGHDDSNGENSAFNPNRNYFYHNGYGNLISIDYIYNNYSNEFYGPIYIEELINYIIDYDDPLNNDEIQEILEECEE